MNQSRDNTADDQNAAALSESPGQRLKGLRESRGIDIERVAAQLHLQRDVVMALEEDRREDLPAPVFVAGYLRNYARLLGVDPEPITRAYRATVPDPEPPLALARSAPGRSGDSGRSGFRLAAFVLLGAAAVSSVLWWQSNPSQDTDVASDLAPAQFGQDGNAPPDAAQPTEDPTASERADQESDPQTETLSEADAGEPGTSAIQVPADAIPLRSPAPVIQPAVIPATPTPPPATPGSATPPENLAATPPAPAPQEVALEFTGTTWVDIRGADGQIVLNGEMREGDRRVLTGQGPYRFVIGNSAATRMSVGGQTFDLAQHSRGNVARFTYGPTATQ